MDLSFQHLMDNQNILNTESTMTNKLNISHMSSLPSIPEVSSPPSSGKRRSILYAISRLKQMKMARQEMHLESNVSSDNIDITPPLANTQSGNTSDNNTVELDHTNNSTQLITVINNDLSKQSIHIDFNSDICSYTSLSSQLQHLSSQSNPLQSYNSLSDDNTTNITDSSTIHRIMSPKESSSLLNITSSTTTTTTTTTTNNNNNNNNIIHHDGNIDSIRVRNNSSKIFTQCLSDSESDEYIDLDTVDDITWCTKDNNKNKNNNMKNKKKKKESIIMNDHPSELTIIINNNNNPTIKQIPQLSNNESIRNDYIQLNESISSHETSPLHNNINNNNNNNNNSRIMESDDYCWICHKPGEVVICSYCPRVFHATCLCATDFPDVWLCPECQDVMLAECSLYQLESWCNITEDQLKRMLFFLLDRLSRQSWARYFREPVDSTIVKNYKELIKYPIDLRTLYTRVKSGQYASPQAFLGDFRWILHNCIIFNGASSSITSSARLLDRTFHREFNLMRACPTCYLNRIPAIHLLPSTTRKLPPLTDNEPESYLTVASVQSSLLLPNESNEIIENDSINIVNGVNDECNNNTPTNTTSNNNESKSSSSSSVSTLDPWWFCKLCDVIHPIVWVRLQNYPRWPAKVIAHDGNFLLVSFFGDYDVTIAPIGSAKLHSSSQSKNLSKLSTITIDSINNNNNIDKESKSDCSGTKSITSIDNNDISNESSVTSQSSKTTSSSLPSTLTTVTTTMDPMVKENFHKAVAELNYHLNLIYQRYPKFKLPISQLRFTKRHVKKYYGPFIETPPPTSSTSETTINLINDTNSIIDMNHTVNTTQVICNTTSHSINTIPSTNVNITTNEKIDNTIKSNRIPSTNDVYREPVLTRVAASLRNSPIITSESTSSSTVLQTLCQPMIDVNPMKRKYNDTSSSSTVTMELESISSEDIHDTIDYNKKKRKKSKHHHLKKITLKPLLMENKTTTIITNLANNDEINSKDDNDSNNNNNMNNDNTVVIEENSLPIENDSEPIVSLTTDEIQSVADSMIPSTSNTSDNVHTILDDFRNSVNEALQKLQEQLAPTINATDKIGVYPLTNSELPNLHPICCDVAIQTNNDIHLLDDSKSLKTINVINDTKSVQTDIMEVSTDLSILNDYRPPTLQERMMEAEILRMEQEVQRLNVLVRYTRAEMGLEMQRRIGELRRIWNDELIAIMEAASRIWEYDVIRIVDIVKRRQWCAYCGRIAYYYCCWNTSYCNSTCQSKHWPFHMASCVQVKSQLNNNKNNLNGSIRHHSQSPNITNSSNITDQPHFSLTQPSILQHIPQNPPPHHHHHQQQQRMILPITSNPSIGMYQLNKDGTLLTTSNTLFQRSVSSSCVLQSQPFKN